MTATKWPNRDRYEWDVWFTVETDMIETLEPEFGSIWLRRESFAVKPTVGTDMERHFLGVSVLSVEVWVEMSYSYHSKSLFKVWTSNRSTHISLNGKPRVSLISVSIGSVLSSHIRDPLRPFICFWIGKRWIPWRNCSFHLGWYWSWRWLQGTIWQNNRAEISGRNNTHFL